MTGFTICCARVESPIAVVICDHSVVFNHQFQELEIADDVCHEAMIQDQCLLALVFTSKVERAHPEWLTVHLDHGVLRNILSFLEADAIQNGRFKSLTLDRPVFNTLRCLCAAHLIRD